MGSKLASVARALRAEALRLGSASFRLRRGLLIELDHVGDLDFDGWELRLSRENGTQPGAVEVRIVRDAFEVPAGAEQRFEGAEVVIQWPES